MKITVTVVKGCEFCVISPTQLLNYLLISALPAFHFQSMEVMLCDSCLSCSVLSAGAKVYASFSQGRQFSQSNVCF